MRLILTAVPGKQCGKNILSKSESVPYKGDGNLLQNPGRNEIEITRKIYIKKVFQPSCKHS
jgi:hypothetical protein